MEGLDNVLLLPPVPNHKVQVYYQAADVVLVPSVTSNDVHEATSLSMHEAMACGTPVVVSNTSLLPEVVADAGLLVNPLNVDGLTSAIEKLLVDEDLTQNLSKKALEKAGHFSWEGRAYRTW